MSARNVSLEQSAMTDRLTAMGERLRRIERRREWRGVVLRTQNEVYDFENPNSGFDNTRIEVASLSIPPGRWVVYGQGSQRIDMVGSPTVLDAWPSLSLRLEWSDDSAENTTTMGLPPGSVGAVNHIVVVGGSPPAASVARLSVMTNELFGPIGFFDWYLYGFSLLAFPG